jgi:Flp pilus assembly protein TadD
LGVTPDAGVALKSSALDKGEGHSSVSVLFGNALAHQNAGQFSAAISIYNKIILVDPSLAGVHSNLGNIFNCLGRFGEAESAFRTAISLKPDFAEAYSGLGNTLKDLGRLEEAEAVHRHAIALNPNLPEAYSNLAVTLAMFGKLGDAEAAYRNAIRLKPELASAYGNLSLLLGEQGRLDEARAAAGQAVELAPRDTRHLLHLGWLRKFEADDPYLRQLENLAEDAASLSVGSQIELHFALAKAYEDIGERDRAFRQLLDGNLLKRRQVAYDEAATIANMKRIEDVFTPELIRNWDGFGEQASLPVFIVGMLRSGSTLVEQILASHPRVFGGGELKLFGKALASLSAEFGEGSAFPSITLQMSGTQFRSLGKRYLSELKRLAPEAERITDKMPANFLNAGLIHLALPNATIIHTIRDPTDTCLSCFAKLFDEAQLHTYDLSELGRYYRSYSRLMSHWRSVLPPERILDVRYEELVDDLEGIARRIVSHCGLPWDSRCLDFHRTERPVRTTSALQVRRPIYKDSVGRSRPYEAFIGPLLKSLSAECEPSHKA